MVFVKVRETYDLHTIKDKISIIGIHTPGTNIIKRNYPGLLMQCKQFRPVKADVRLACASVLPLDPQGVGTDALDVAPEDIFNPILYKAVSNESMSLIDAYLNSGRTLDINGSIIDAQNTGVSSDDFALYYGLLSQTHGWKHANPQSGLAMNGLVPLVYEMYQNIGDNSRLGAEDEMPVVNPDGSLTKGISVQTFRGRPHALPMLNTTVFEENVTTPGTPYSAEPGFRDMPRQVQQAVPLPKIYCGVIIVPPSRLHELYYRMVVEWTIEFSSIRPLGDITNFAGLQVLGNTSHYMSYDYSNSKKVEDSELKESTDMIDTSEGSGIKKVM